MTKKAKLILIIAAILVVAAVAVLLIANRYDYTDVVKLYDDIKAGKDVEGATCRIKIKSVTNFDMFAITLVNYGGGHGTNFLTRHDYGYEPGDVLKCRIDSAGFQDLIEGAVIWFTPLSAL